jgi:SAM-dependent methyltransferase
VSADRTTHVETQRAFYESREHRHLRPRDRDAYAEKLVSELARRSGIEPHHRVLEVGAGFGRFTFPLLRRCGSIVALDSSRRVLEALELGRDERGIPKSRCETWCADLEDAELGAAREPFDFVVGFFILHHVPDLRRALANLGQLLGAGGRMAFLEPNRRNPLYLAQLSCCADMTWSAEKGLFRLSAASVADACRAAGMRPERDQKLGFFPPQLYNRFAWCRELESRLERRRWLAPILPFLLLRAGRSDGASNHVSAAGSSRLPPAGT